MRLAFSILVLSACAPDIAAGTYFCGAEELCPNDLVCDRTTNLCENTAKPFACGTRNVDVPGDDSEATAQSLGALECVSLVQERRSCLPLGDAGDFYTFTVPAGCTTAHVRASVTFPIAFQRVVLQIAKAGDAPATIASPCPSNNTDDDGTSTSCLDAPVAAGTYVVGVVPDGTGTCDNECRFNRYSLALQIVTE